MLGNAGLPGIRECVGKSGTRHLRHFGAHGSVAESLICHHGSVEDVSFGEAIGPLIHQNSSHFLQRYPRF
jgi:hypothetical protein